MLESHALIGRGMCQHVENNRRTAKMRDPVLDDELEYLSGVDLAKTQLRAAGSDHRPGIGPPGAMNIGSVQRNVLSNESPKLKPLPSAAK
jgi:hypothetical protein